MPSTLRNSGVQVICNAFLLVAGRRAGKPTRSVSESARQPTLPANGTCPFCTIRIRTDTGRHLPDPANGSRHGFLKIVGKAIAQTSPSGIDEDAQRVFSEANPPLPQRQQSAASPRSSGVTLLP